MPKLVDLSLEYDENTLKIDYNKMPEIAISLLITYIWRVCVYVCVSCKWDQILFAIIYRIWTERNVEQFC